MKVAVKPVNGPVGHYEVESSIKVEDMKKKVEEAQKYPAERQVLVYDGKVLKNEQTLEDVKFEDGRFMVVMVTKEKKAQPKPSVPTSSSEVTAERPSQTAPAAYTPAGSAPSTDASMAAAGQGGGAAAAAADQSGEVPTPASGSGDFYNTNASTLSAGPALESHVTQMVDMGFERSQVQQAMRAAYNNPDRAVEYLMSGIPEDAEPPPPVTAPSPAPPSTAVGTPVSTATASGTVPPASTPAPAPQVDRTRPNEQPLDMFPQGMPAAAAAGGLGGGESGGEGLGDRLAFLRSNPQFQGLRQVVQNNPAILQPMLSELGRQNPQLLQLINSNQEEFLAMVNEPVGEGMEGAGDLSGLANMMTDDPQLGGALDEDGAGGQTIQITEEEAAAIQRLQGLGFPRNACIEAFFACDKNEALAANFLLGDGN